MTDSSKRDITQESATNWVSTEPGIATISTSGADKGEATGVAVGQTKIKATHGQVTGEADLTVTPAVLTSLTIDPTSVDVKVSGNSNFTATGHYTDGSHAPLTKEVSWESEDTRIATVGNGATEGGRVTGVKEGSTTVKASKRNADGDTITSPNAQINVTCKDLAEACIDIFDAKNDGRLFTSSPSKAYLDSIGGSATDDIGTENGTNGPSGTF